MKSGKRISPTSFCSAWAAPAFAPKFSTKTFGQIPGFPRLHVLDSTDPAQVKAIEAKINLAKTLFIVSSKSGTTLEPNIFKQYFFERVKQAVGAEKAGSRFIAVTDPGSKLQTEAEADKFRHIFPGVPSIGGRYSALSNFGIVPAAAMGLDVAKFLDRTEEMVQACAASVPVEQNPGVVLGAHSRHRREIRPRQNHLHHFARQFPISARGSSSLIAESTGKQGKGIIPVDREALAAPEVYGNDRIFAYLRFDRRRRLRSRRQGRCARKSRAAGHPHRGRRHSTTSARNFSAGKLPPPSPVPSSASTPSISPTSKPAKSKPAS